ncbi:MAG: GAF domain-containing protein [Desulfobacterales bacterium]|nr:GAF domain-containing protein [Desulfobacterales bacterium]
MKHQREQQNQALTTLFSISQTVNKSLDLDQILNDALEKVTELFKCHFTFIRILDHQTQELVLAAHKGLSSEDLKLLIKRRKLGNGSANISLTSDKVSIVEDASSDPRTAHGKGFTAKMGIRGMIIIPLSAKNKLQGNMAMAFIEPRAYSDEEISFFSSMGALVGSAIENARLYQEQDATIQKLNETRKELQKAADALKNRVQALDTLFAISQTVNQTLNLDQILNEALDKVMELFKPYNVSVRLLDTQTQEMVFAAQKGGTPEDLKKLPKRRRLGQSTASIT